MSATWDGLVAAITAVWPPAIREASWIGILIGPQQVRVSRFAWQDHELVVIATPVGPITDIDPLAVGTINRLLVLGAIIVEGDHYVLRATLPAAVDPRLAIDAIRELANRAHALPEAARKLRETQATAFPGVDD